MSPIYIVKSSIGKAEAKFTIGLTIVTVVGFIYMAAYYNFQTTEIGSFFEKTSDFEEQYEAIIYLDEKPIFCIADVQKHKDPETGSYYTINKLSLPYGKFDYCDGEEYDPSYGNNEVHVGFYSEFCRIEIGDVATEKSVNMLEHEIVSAHGYFCASRKGEKYHHVQCPSAANIAAENKIFFESEEEANLLMFDFCNLCIDH